MWFFQIFSRLDGKKKDCRSHQRLPQIHLSPISSTKKRKSIFLLHNRKRVSIQLYAIPLHYYFIHLFTLIVYEHWNVENYTHVHHMHTFSRTSTHLCKHFSYVNSLCFARLFFVCYIDLQNSRGEPSQIWFQTRTFVSRKFPL